MYAIRFYRMYDIGKEVNLKDLDAKLATAYNPERASFTRINPKSILMETPPLSFHLPRMSLTSDGKEYTLLVTARVYDFGAVSLCFILEDMAASAATLKEIALLFAGQRGLDPLFSLALAQIHDILLPSIETLAIDQVPMYP